MIDSVQKNATCRISTPGGFKPMTCCSEDVNTNHPVTFKLLYTAVSNKTQQTILQALSISSKGISCKMFFTLFRQRLNSTAFSAALLGKAL